MGRFVVHKKKTKREENITALEDGECCGGGGYEEQLRSLGFFSMEQSEG